MSNCPVRFHNSIGERRSRPNQPNTRCYAPAERTRCSLGLVLFVDSNETPEVQTEKAMKEKWSEEKGSALIIVNATTPELIDFMSMSEPSTKGIKAPVFKLQSLSGETVSLKELRGKTVLLGFWTTW